MLEFVFRRKTAGNTSHPFREEWIAWAKGFWLTMFFHWLTIFFVTVIGLHYFTPEDCLWRLVVVTLLIALVCKWEPFFHTEYANKGENAYYDILLGIIGAWCITFLAGRFFGLLLAVSMADTFYSFLLAPLQWVSQFVH